MLGRPPNSGPRVVCLSSTALPASSAQTVPLMAQNSWLVERRWRARLPWQKSRLVLRRPVHR
jgi:hypothetical protein